MKIKKILKIATSLLLFCAMVLNFSACTAKAYGANLLEGVTARKVNERQADEEFISSSADFAFKIFKNSVKEEENSLISPLSVMLALAMVANGADGQTRTEMEALIGEGISIDYLNEYLHSYVNSLPSDKSNKLRIANSIWFRDEENHLKVEKDFLQINADYYNAAAYKSAFDKQTLKNINDWVKENTDGMIDKIIDDINKDAIMYLINALVFDAEWETPYQNRNVRDGEFHAIDGSVRQVEMMSSGEHEYIDTGNATGFIKQYKNNNYSFVALLPNEDVDIYEYISSLTGEEFMSAVEKSESATVSARLPKFSYEYEIKMNDVLSSLGMPKAFDESSADFSKLGSSSIGNIYIGNVLHKTFISLNEFGTKAGAVTKVEMLVGSAAPTDIKYVILDRPFVYAIIDNETKLPFFIGTVMDIGK